MQEDTIRKENQRGCESSNKLASEAEDQVKIEVGGAGLFYGKINLMESDEPKPNGAIWLFIILVLIGFAAATIYFGRGNKDLAAVQPSANLPTPTRQARVYTVYYGLGVFSPTNIRIHVGDSVKFQNDGNLSIRVVSDRVSGVPELAGFDSVNDVPPEDSFTFIFTEAGTFGYHNGRNPNEEGTIIVRPQ